MLVKATGNEATYWGAYTGKKEGEKPVCYWAGTAADAIAKRQDSGVRAWELSAKYNYEYIPEVGDLIQDKSDGLYCVVDSVFNGRAIGRWRSSIYTAVKDAGAGGAAGIGPFELVPRSEYSAPTIPCYEAPAPEAPAPAPGTTVWHRGKENTGPWLVKKVKDGEALCIRLGWDGYVEEKVEDEVRWFDVAVLTPEVEDSDEGSDLVTLGETVWIAGLRNFGPWLVISYEEDGRIAICRRLGVDGTVSLDPMSQEYVRHVREILVSVRPGEEDCPGWNKLELSALALGIGMMSLGGAGVLWLLHSMF